MKTIVALAMTVATLAYAPAFAAVTFCSDLQAGAEALLTRHGGGLPDFGAQALAPLEPTATLGDRRDAALVAAATLGQVTWVKQLLDAGAQIDWRDPGTEFSLTPLVAAAWCGHSAVVDQLLQAGADARICAELPFAGMDRISVCPLHAAVSGPEFDGGDPAIVVALREHGADAAQEDGQRRAAAVYLDQVSPERRAALAAALASKP